jgi:hypothetical protein
VVPNGPVDKDGHGIAASGWSVVHVVPPIPAQVVAEDFSLVPRTGLSRRSKLNPAMKLFNHLIGAGDQRRRDG